MVQPYLTYRELSAATIEERGAWVLLRRPLLWLLVTASFVSFTTTGRWVWVHVSTALVAWSFVPAYQILLVGLIGRRAARGRPLEQVVDLFFMGQGPWLLFFLLIAAVCLFAPDAWATFGWLLDFGLLPVALLATLGWSGVLTWAFFRGALELDRGAAALAAGLFYAGFAASIVGWYTAAGQLLPLLLHTR